MPFIACSFVFIIQNLAMRISSLILVCCFVFSLSLCITVNAQRKDISLNENWLTSAHDSLRNDFIHFEENSFKTVDWKKVSVPHNWDNYEGYRRLLHGNRHGVAWYRKHFTCQETAVGKRFFLYFEGVGSYAYIWLNGKYVGSHAGGRTTFTLDVTNEIRLGNRDNILAVRADHPAQDKGQPWLCGGCSTERGFSEGSQPMGIFRPVHLIVTKDVRIQPFGIHIWNDTTVSDKQAQLYVRTQLKAYRKQATTIQLIQELRSPQNQLVFRITQNEVLQAGQEQTLVSNLPLIQNPILWSPENPYRYTLVTRIMQGNILLDEQKTPYGIRWMAWKTEQGATRFFVNGKPVFINGIAEYEHLLGNSHAFGEEQIKARVSQIKSAGFNAFRDAHQPHNLRYQEYWDSAGILWWTQLAAHVWYDTPAFRNNFKTLLKEWVIERRNSPSVMLWGLENESTLPEDFAKECTALIRELDPTASIQRKVTTCNGGKGTDWDVPQNWTGTYGGNPETYGQDLERQILVGEYGAWRTLDAHQESTSPTAVGVFSEDAMAQLMELKIKLAETVKDKVGGHFFWLFNSHDNPGRVQSGEALRELDRIGPVNYKGLFTPWEEPLDAYYMYRANFAPKTSQPMLYIASHTWADRWTSTGIKSGIKVYSNCDEVELFNDVNQVSLGRKKRGGIGTHFQWDNVSIQYNVLYAVGYINGKKVAQDYIILHHLPEAPHLNDLDNGTEVNQSDKKIKYVYRVNCGGATYTDKQGNTWFADQEKTYKNTWGSLSWTANFKGMPAFYASQRRTFDPIKRTKDDALFQTFRYGREQLSYHFHVPDGTYQVELYFIEPWFGTGGGSDCSAWRLFDVAINDEVKIKNLDIWKEVGHDALLKKTVLATVKGGNLTISFPRIAASQALISAIAIGAIHETKGLILQHPSLLLEAEGEKTTVQTRTWLDTGNPLFLDNKASIVSLPSVLYGATYLYKSIADNIRSIHVKEDADVFIAIDSSLKTNAFLKDFENTGQLIQTTLSASSTLVVFKKRMKEGTNLNLFSAGFPPASFIVLASPVSTIQPPYDLKTSVTYKATSATTEGSGIVQEMLMGKERMLVKEAGVNALIWTIKTGVADQYSLTIKYHNPSSETLKGKLSIILSDGTVIKKDEVLEFPPSKEGKWSYISTNTGTMINAGTYRIILQAASLKGIYLDALDVQ